MCSNPLLRLAAVLCAAVLFVPTCDDWAAAAPRVDDTKVSVTYSYRAANLTGMTVRNSEGDDLGRIEDLLVDVRDGQIAYAILSYGGFFGLGDKLFPIPWREMKLHHDEQEKYFVIDATPQFLRRIPSFDREHWPDKDAGWSELVESLFPVHSGIVVAATEDRLVMTFANGGGEHAHPVAIDALVTRDGETVHLLDLERGDRVRVTTEAEAGIRAITKIEAQSADEDASHEEDADKPSTAPVEQ